MDHIILCYLVLKEGDSNYRDGHMTAQQLMVTVMTYRPQLGEDPDELATISAGFGRFTSIFGLRRTATWSQLRGRFLDLAPGCFIKSTSAA